MLFFSQTRTHQPILILVLSKHWFRDRKLAFIAVCRDCASKTHSLITKVHIVQKKTPHLFDFKTFVKNVIAFLKNVKM